MQTLSFGNNLQYASDCLIVGSQSSALILASCRTEGVVWGGRLSSIDME